MRNTRRKQSGFVSILVLVIASLLIVAAGILGYSRIQKKDIQSTNPVSISTAQNQPTNTTTTPAVDPAKEGTLTGQVLCTVKIGEDPCPSASSIDVESITTDPRMGSNGIVKTAQTDANGKYEIKLLAGKYDVTPQPKAGFPVIVPIANPVTISAGHTTTVNINYMDGTR